MKKLTIASIRMLYRDRQALLWALAFPVIFACVFGVFDLDSPPELDFALVTTGSSGVAEALQEELQRVESFNVTTSSNHSIQRERLKDGELDVVVAVRSTTSSQREKALVEVLYNNSDAQNAQIGLDAVTAAVSKTTARMSGAIARPIALNEVPLNGRSIKYYDFLLPGLVAMAVMNFAIMGTAVTVSQFREQGILKRILASPLQPQRFVVAQVTARLILAVAQTGLILAVGMLVFDANVYGNLLSLFAFALIINLIFLNFGFAIGGRASSSDAAQGTANVLAYPMMFLSGVFFPLEALPESMQTLVRLLPLTPAIEGMRAIAVEGKGIASTTSHLLLLTMWLSISLVVARFSFRFSESPGGGTRRGPLRKRSTGQHGEVSLADAR